MDINTGDYTMSVSKRERVAECVARAIKAIEEDGRDAGEVIDEMGPETTKFILSHPWHYEDFFVCLSKKQREEPEREASGTG